MVVRINPEDYFKEETTTTLVPRANPITYQPPVYYTQASPQEIDKTILILALVTLGIVAMVCITGIIVARK